MTLMDQYLEDARKHEGFREFAYPDPLSELARKYPRQPWGFKPAREILNFLGVKETKGVPWTVGYGYTHGVTPDHRFTREMAEHKLKEVILASIADAKRLVSNFEDQPDAVKTVLVSMAYNMGYTKLSGFRNTLRFAVNKDYTNMANGMEKSLWYSQTGRRAKELVKRVRTLKI